MAAVMAAGMVPPLAVFVATVLFKDKFTQEERDSGLTNIVMGLSFITEGAIPFGAADPARAIPSFIARFSFDRCSCWSCRLETHGSSRRNLRYRPYIKSTSLHLVRIDRCSRKWYLVRIASQT